jgi:hypothetical protein
LPDKNDYIKEKNGKNKNCVELSILAKRKQENNKRKEKEKENKK